MNTQEEQVSTAVETDAALIRERMSMWTAALRSGRFKQGEEYLHTVIYDEEQFCCLGVGCVKAGIKSDAESKRETEEFRVDRLVVRYGASLSADGMPPLEFYHWIGLEPDEAGDPIYVDFPTWLHQQKNGMSTLADGADLAELNDHAKLTFGQIADLIDYFGVVVRNYYDNDD